MLDQDMTQSDSSIPIMDVWDIQMFPGDVVLSSKRARRHAAYINRKLAGIKFNPHPALTPIRPIMLESDIRSVINATSKHLVNLIHRVCWSVTSDPLELARSVGLRLEQVPLLCAADAEHEINFSACNGRLDVLIQDGVPLFLEANFSAANMDPIVTHYLLDVYRTLYGVSAAAGPDATEEPFEARARLYRRICRERNVPESVVIVGNSEISDVGDIRYYESEAHYLRTQGFTSDLVKPEYFNGIGSGDRYSVALKHFLSEYWQPLGIPLDGMRSAHKTTTFIVPDSGRCLSSKLIFAWLSAGTVPLSPAERYFVRKHIPWTRRMEHSEVEYEGRIWDLEYLAKLRREEFVLKPLTTCGGSGVILGQNTRPETWAQLVAEAIEQRNHILQKYIETDKLQMDFYDHNAEALRRLNVNYVLGLYFVDGVNAGIGVRHVPSDTAGVVNVNQGASFNVVL